LSALFDSLRRLLAGVIAIAQTRLELVTTELAAEVQRAIGVLLWAAVALFFGGISVLMIAITIVVATPERWRWLSSGLVAAAFVATAVGAALVARRQVRDRPPFLAASLGELRRDREALEAGLRGAGASSDGGGDGDGRAGAGGAAGAGAGDGSRAGATSGPRAAATR
jgi:uncharacterized membrane protein YqjE